MSQCSVEGKAWWIIQMRIRVHTVKLTVSSPQKEFVLHSVVNKKKKVTEISVSEKEKESSREKHKPCLLSHLRTPDQFVWDGSDCRFQKVTKIFRCSTSWLSRQKGVRWGGFRCCSTMFFLFCSRTDARLCYSGNEQMIKDAIVFHLFYELWGHEKKQNIYYAITKKHC